MRRELSFPEEKKALVEYIGEFPKGIDILSLLAFAQELKITNLEIALKEAQEKDDLITFDGDKYFPVLQPKLGLVFDS